MIQSDSYIKDVDIDCHLFLYDSSGKDLYHKIIQKYVSNQVPITYGYILISPFSNNSEALYVCVNSLKNFTPTSNKTKIRRLALVEWHFLTNLTATTKISIRVVTSSFDHLVDLFPPLALSQIYHVIYSNKINPITAPLPPPKPLWKTGQFSYRTETQGNFNKRSYQ